MKCFMENKNIKILAIDDNQDNLIIIQALINESFPTVEIFTALTGEQGIELAALKDPDVILLDIIMPIMDGFEVCSRLKNDKNLSDIPVVFVTALKGDKGSRIRGLEVGGEAFLAKPIDESELVAQIRAMVKIKSGNVQRRNENIRLAAIVEERTLELKKTNIETLKLLEDLKNENENRKRTEEALRESEARLTRAELASKSGNWELHLDSKIIVSSIGATKIYGTASDNTKLDLEYVKKIVLPEYRPALDVALINLIEKDEPYNIEYKIKKIDSSEIIDVHSIAFFDKEKRIVFGIIRDITERKVAQDALYKSEELYRSVINASPDNITVTDLRGNILMVSPKGYSLIGYSSEKQIINRNIIEFLAPKDQDRAEKNIFGMFRGVFNGPEEYSLNKSDGSTLDVEINAEFVRNVNGQPTGLVFAIRNISERKQAQNALRESELKYRLITEKITDVVWIMDLTGKSIFVSQSIEKFTGYSIDEYLAQSIEERFTPASSKFILQALKQEMSDYKAGKALKTNYQRRLILDYVCKDKSIKTGELLVTPYFNEHDELTGLHGVTRDISERRQAEKALLESEEKYRFMTENTSDVIWHMDPNFCFDYVSNAAKRVLGYDPIELTGQYLWKLLNSNGVKSVEDRIAEYNLSEVGIPNEMQFEFESKCKDGNWIWVEASVSTHKNDKDTIIGFYGITRNITERKLAEEALKESEDRYNTFINNNIDMIFVKDENLRYLIANNSMAHFFGKTSEELLNKTDLELTESGRILPCLSSDKRALETNGAVIIEEQLGDKVYETVKFPMLLKNNKKGVGGILRDITARKQAEERLQHVTRLYALLSQINQIIVRTKNMDELFQSICQYAIEFGQFRMGWIGIYDETENIIKPKYFAGDNNGYLDDIIITPRRTPQGLGPTGFALREGKIAFSNNIATDPAMSPWKDAALSRGYQSAFSVPFFRKGKAFGTLTLYASEINFFDEDEQKLLSEIGEDISFALDAMDSDNDRKLAEIALQNSRSELKTIYDHAPVMMCVVDKNRRILFANNAFTSLTQASEDIVKGKVVGGVIGCINSMDTPGGCGHGIKCSNCGLRIAMEDTFKTGIGLSNIEYQSTLNIGGKLQEISLLGSTALIQTSEHESLLVCLYDITDRKLAEDALHKSEMLLRTFIDNTPFEIWARDNDGVGILENKKLVEHSGSIIGQTLRSNSRIDKRTSDLLVNINNRVLEGEVIDEEYEFGINGENRIYQQIVFPIKNNSKIIGIAGFNIDITERKRVEEALHNSEALYHSFVEHMPAGVFRKDNKGRFIFVNSIFCDLKGLSANDILGKTRNELASYIDEVLQNKPNKIRYIQSPFLFDNETDHELIMKTGNPIETEEIYTNTDGTSLYLDVVKSPVFSSTGEVIGTQGIQFDITQRKRTEEALNESQEQLKKFAAHLQNIREEERVALAREIHDELGQILIAIKIDMGMLKQSLLKETDINSSHEIVTKLENLSGLIDTTIKTARKIMTDLRPEVLDLLGFTDAVKQHLKSFQERYKISCKFESSAKGIQPNSQQSVALFRIIQEALNNVAKHSKATEVKVIVKQNNEKLILEVTDNGIGFDPNQKKKNDSYGLIGMNERVFLLDGELSIKSEIGKGTTVKLQMPYVN